MTTLNRCARCEGFLPASAARCPHCETALPRWVKLAATVLGGTALSMTLSACYGGSCAGGGCYEPVPVPPTCDEEHADADGDGFCDEPREPAQSDSMSTSSV